MMRWALALGLVAASAAFGQATSRVQVIDVTNDPEVIDGNTLRPDVTAVDTRAPASFSKLIQVRQDFKDKIRSTQLP